MDAIKKQDDHMEERISCMIRTYEKDLLRLCRIQLRENTLAEDAVQETFIKAYRNLRSFHGNSSEKTWLFRIAINVCTDMQRTSWFRSMKHMVSIESVPVSQPQESEISHALMTEIMRMPKKYREIILLYYYEDMKQNEIAEILRVSVATVSRRIEKARELLRDSLKGGEGSEA